MAYVYQRKINGKKQGPWYFRINRTLNGKRMPINSNGGYRLQSLAMEAANTVEQELKHGKFKEPTDETFDSYYLHWYETFYKGKKSRANDDHYVYALSLIKKYFDKMKMKDITRYNYQDFLNEFGKHHAKATVLKGHIYISKCLKEAHRDGLINSDPTYNAVITGNDALEKPEEEKFMHLDDFKKLVRYVYTHLNPRRISNYIILIMSQTGMRFEEADGLTWDCIDFDNETIRINKTWNYSHKPYGFGPTKNKSSNRSIFVDKNTMGVLRKLKALNSQRQLMRPGFNENNLVFYRIETKRPISNDATNEQLKKLCFKLEIIQKDDNGKYIKPYTTHALRHTHASLLIYNKRDIAYISKRLGHENIMTTYNTYVHIIKEMTARNDSQIESVASEVLGIQDL